MFSSRNCRILSGVLRAGELPAEGMQAKARMDTLIPRIPHGFESRSVGISLRLSGSNGGGQAAGHSADDGKLHLLHACTPPVAGQQKAPAAGFSQLRLGNSSSSDGGSMLQRRRKRLAPAAGNGPAAPAPSVRQAPGLRRMASRISPSLICSQRQRILP